MRCFAVCGFAALVALGGCKKDVSGSYLAEDKVTVSWLQLVRTPDNHLTGQIVSSDLTPDGKIEQASVPLTGAVNGEDVSLTGSSSFLGTPNMTLSGTFDGNTLTVTGVKSAPITLKRATLAEYQARLAEQTTRSHAVISANAAAEAQQRTLQANENFIVQVDQLIGQMQRVDVEADVHLGKFPNAEKAYQAITVKVNEYVTRERQLAGKFFRSAERSQLYMVANQLSLNTDQMHYQAQSLESSRETNIAPLVNEATSLEHDCRQDGPVSGDLTSLEIEARQSACNRLLTAAPTFHQKYDAVTAGLNNLEAVYRREKDAQQRLLVLAQEMK